SNKNGSEGCIRSPSEYYGTHHHSYNDALVVELRSANRRVFRVLIDISSLAIILFASAYRKMNISGEILRPSKTPMYGFTGECVHPEGVIRLPIMFGEEPTTTTQMVDSLFIEQRRCRVVKGVQTLAGECYAMATKSNQKEYMAFMIYHVDDVEVIPQEAKAMNDFDPREQQKEKRAGSMEDMESI
ncbi:hypothetical protein TorRG33x02_354480, partial [Trema orientale]